MSPDDRTAELLQRARDVIEAAESISSINASIRARGYELALKARDTAEQLRRMREDGALQPIDISGRPSREGCFGIGRVLLDPVDGLTAQASAAGDD